MFGIFYFPVFHYIQNDLTVFHGFQSGKFILEVFTGNFSTQTGRFAGMREIHSVDSVFVVIQGYIAPDGSPQTYAVDGEDIFSLSVYFCHKHVQAVVFFHFFFVGGRKFAFVFFQCAVFLHQHVGFYIFIIFCLGISHVSDVQCGEDLLFSIHLHILILCFLQRRAYKSQQKCYDNNHYRSINEGVSVTVGIHLSFGILMVRLEGCPFLAATDVVLHHTIVNERGKDVHQ